VVPTVTGGKVFVGAAYELDVYGMLGSNPARLAAPVYAPTPGTYAAAQSVTISASSGSTIHYTLDGSLPTLSSPVYTGPIVVSATTAINAVAVQSGSLTSPVATATYTIGSGAPAPIAFVQGNYATPQTPQSTVSVPFTAAQGSGDLNIVVVGWNDSTATVGTVTDSSGNVYQRAVGPTVYSGTATQSIYYTAGIVGAAANANTVTVTFTTAAAYPDIRILEYSGIATTSPLDVTAAATGSGSTASSGAATTTNANDLIFGADLTVTTTTGAGSGFTSRIITVPDSDIAEDRIVTATGSYAATASTTPGAWIMQMAAFRRHP
jgi:hypothetical protein